MPKVNLINYTPDAVNLLLFTKNTRLMNTDDAYAEIAGWPEDKKKEELDYMLKTIKSSWEFIDYVFELREVSRAFTHQFVRTRQGSYAQQSQRTVNMEGFGYVVPKGLEENEDGWNEYTAAMADIQGAYEKLVNKYDVAPEDARGILPTNIHTNIIAKFNLRTLHEMAKSRLSPRAQGEYQDIFRLMIEAVVEVHPWARDFLEPTEWAAPSMAKPLNPKGEKK